MDPIKNVSVNDYAMTMPQQNNVQQTPEEDYSSMPMVYDPTTEEKRNSASSGLGLKALGAIGIAGLALWAGHSWGSKGIKAAKEAEDAAKKAMDEAVAKADKLQKANDAAYEIAENGHKKGLFNKSELRKDIKKALRPDEAEAKKTEEKAAEAAKKTEGAEKTESTTNPDNAEKSE